MTRLRPFALIAFVALATVAPTAAADYWGDYASAVLGERLRQDQSIYAWRDAMSRPARPADDTPNGVRSWVADDRNPWANAYGTPAANAWRATTARPLNGRILRVCSCYLPADARSWDGGPLTPADIARLCTAQCF